MIIKLLEELLIIYLICVVFAVISIFYFLYYDYKTYHKSKEDNLKYYSYNDGEMFNEIKNRDE